jgi:hypothetical protein
MHEFGARREFPELKQLVVEASRALALLDTDRLEELALSCQALNQDLAAAGTEDLTRLAPQARDAAADMAAFARVLDVTRDNLYVMQRLRELRMGRLEYAERPASGWAHQKSEHGDN